MEVETDSGIPFLDMLVIRKGSTLDTRSTENPKTPAVISISKRIIHHMWKEELCRVHITELLSHAKSNQTALTKLIFWDTSCSLSAYPIRFLDSVINRYKRNIRLKKEVLPLGFISIRYTTGDSEPFKRIAKKCNIRNIFKKRYSMRNSLIRTRPIRAPQQTANCVWSIPCECGRSYIGETGRMWEVRIRKHRQNWRGGHMDRPRLVQHSLEENHRIAWMEAKILNKRIQYIQNIRKQPISHAYKTPPADSAQKFRPPGIL